MKRRLVQTASLLIAFGVVAALAMALELRGFSSYLVIVFLGYCAIIVVSHLLAALALVWRELHGKPKALLLWQTRQQARHKQ